MNQINRLLMLALYCLVCESAFVGNVAAETWTDSTGKFQIEAEFRGVQGKNIVLEKPDGTAIQVPIARLSEASRQRAKQLYEQSKQEATAGTASPSVVPVAAIEKSSMATGLDRSKLKFSPPKSPPLPPMPNIPDEATLQATIDHVKTSLMDGHPEVLWHALPAEIRETLDSDSVRAAIGPQMNRQEAVSQQMEAMTLKAVEVLLTKKEFILNSPLLAQVPPDLATTIRNAYDPGVGMIYELLNLSAAMRSLDEQSFTKLFDEHGPMIGGHLKPLIAIAPPEIVSGFLDKINVQEVDEQTGTVTMTSPNGQTTETTFVRYGGRWIPQQLADAWPEKQDNIGEALAAAMDGANEQGEQYTMMIGMFTGMANSVLDPMLAATTQQDFDNAVAQVMQMASGMGQGGQPGAIGPTDDGGETPLDGP